LELLWATFPTRLGEGKLMDERYICKICNNSDGNVPFIAYEMMYGMKDEFKYFECRFCGCLQILEIPNDLTKYYPTDYYSFEDQPDVQYKLIDWVKFYLRRTRTNYILTGKGIVGKAISYLRDDNTFDWDWFRKSGIGLNAAILDVGCGAGKLLKTMCNHGFSNLSGIDPYNTHDITFKSIKIFKKELAELEGSFDLIMLHHSFEHMSKPLFALQQINRLLKPMRYAIIRVPLSGSYAWRKYGSNWVQLDAPRHLFLHTPKSMNILAKQSGFEIADVVFDSTSFQFTGSEKYMIDIPMKNLKSNMNSLGNSIFDKTIIDEYKIKAAELNRAKEGDQACFYFRKTSDSKGEKLGS
jgi:SAM-dependent methyltransferase